MRLSLSCHIIADAERVVLTSRSRGLVQTPELTIDEYSPEGRLSHDSQQEYDSPCMNCGFDQPQKGEENREERARYLGTRILYAPPRSLKRLGDQIAKRPRNRLVCVPFPLPKFSRPFFSFCGESFDLKTCQLWPLTSCFTATVCLLRSPSFGFTPSQSPRRNQSYSHRNTMGQSIIPLIILVVVVVVLSVVGYIVYSIVQEVSKNTRSKMEKKNVMFTRDGMKVGVKEISEEVYVDRSQSVLVNMWNHTSFPAYKSRLWNTTGTADAETEKRKPY